MRSRVGEMMLGLVIAVFVVAAFVSPPLSGLDTLPSLGVVLIALGILLEDALFALLGSLVGTGGIFVTIFFGVQATRLIGDLFS